MAHSLCPQVNPSFWTGSFPLLDECFHFHLSCHKTLQWGLIAVLFWERIVGFDAAQKTLVLKRPGQTNSGVLCVPQEPPLGRSVAAPKGPIVAYFDNMSRNRCNEAPLRGFLPSVRFPIVARRNPPMGLGGGHPTCRPLLDRFDSPSVRLDRVRAFPPSSLLLARADTALGPSAIECRPLSCGRSGRIRFEAKQIKPSSR